MKKNYTPAQWIITAVCVFLMFFNKFLPCIPGLNEIGTSTVYIFVCSLVMMVAVGIIWTPFLTILAFATNGVYTLTAALQTSMGHSVVWIIILSGIILGVLIDTGFLRRVAVWMITLPFARKSPWKLVMAIILAGFVIGCFMDPTVTVIMMFALCAEIMNTLGIVKGKRIGEFLMISICSFVAVSYCCTTLGHSVPLTIMSLFESVGTYNQLQYLVGGIVVGLVFFALYIIVYRFIFKIDVSEMSNFDADALKATLSPISKQEKYSAIIYLAVVVLWLLPSCLTKAAPGFSGFMTKLGANAPLLAAIIVMSLIRVDGAPLLDVTKQMKTNVPWTAAVLVGANMLLGASITNPDAGITGWLTEMIGPLFSSMPPYLFVVLICFVALVVKQFTASMLVTSLICGITVPLLAGGAITGVNCGALAFCISVITALGWGTPSTGSWGALLGGQGWVRSKNQLVEGMLGAFIGYLAVVLVGYPLMCMLIG